jgi:glycerophosphoryl diester phosphodiesterase
MAPLVIAHRGASGYLPEHTFAAKQLAHEMGADYLEQDVVASRDDELVVLHDIHLDRVTDVADQFPARAREDGRFYVRDFDIDELRSLQVWERMNVDGTAVYPNRYPVRSGDFRLHTLAEEIEFIHGLNAQTGRRAGIYPEIKRPAWHSGEGVDIAPLLIDILATAGYEHRDDPVYLQCFDDAELRRIRHDLGCELKLVQLIGENVWGEAATDYVAMRTADGLAQLSRTVDGIGPWLPQVSTDLVRMAHDAGLAVHPYTFRADDLPAGVASFDELVRYFVVDVGVDGLFTDFPDKVLDLRLP